MLLPMCIENKRITQFYLFIVVNSLTAVYFLQSTSDFFIGLAVFLVMPFIFLGFFNLMSYIVWQTLANKLEIKGSKPKFVGKSLKTFIHEFLLFKSDKKTI
jgi:hypothetical protein